MGAKSNIIRFIKTSLAYFVGNVSTKLISFLLIPIYTAALDPSEYGVYDLIVSIINLIAPLAFFQIWDGVFRFAFDNDDANHKVKIINNGLVVNCVGILLLIIFDIVLKIVYPKYITIWVVVYGICYALQYFYTVIARVYLNNVLFSASGVVNAFVAAIINIVLIKYYGMGVDSLYIAASLGIIIQMIMIEVKFRTIMNFSFYSIDKNCIKDMVRFSFPLCISTIAYWMLNGYSKIIISEKLGVYENGLYAVANKFTSLILIVVSVIQFAWNEMVYIMSSKTDKKEVYETGIRFIFSATILSASAFIYIARLLFPYIVDESYFEAIGLIPISMIGVAMNSFASFSGTLFLANKKSGFLLSTTFFAVLTNVVLSWCLVSKYELYGVLIALSISLVVLAVSRLIALYLKYHIRLYLWNYLTILVMFGCISAFYLCNAFIFNIGMIIMVLVLTLFLMKNELKVLFRMLLKRKG